MVVFIAGVRNLTIYLKTVCPPSTYFIFRGAFVVGIEYCIIINYHVLHSTETFVAHGVVFKANVEYLLCTEAYVGHEVVF